MKLYNLKQAFNTRSAHVWACFPHGSTVRHPFLYRLDIRIHHILYFTSLRGLFRTLYIGRKVRNEKKKKNSSCHGDSNPWPFGHDVCALPLRYKCCLNLKQIDLTYNGFSTQKLNLTSKSITNFEEWVIVVS